MARAQGLPMSFIVLAAISSLILVLIVFFVTGAGSKLMGTIGGAQESDLATAISNCQSLCEQARLASSWKQFDSSGFCTKTFALKTGTGTAKAVRCWNTDDIDLPCQMLISEAVCQGDKARRQCGCWLSGCHYKSEATQEYEADCQKLVTKASCEKIDAAPEGWTVADRMPGDVCAFDRLV